MMSLNSDLIHCIDPDVGISDAPFLHEYRNGVKSREDHHGKV